MVIYILNLISVFFWSVFTAILKIKNKALVFSIIMGTQLFLLSGLRSVTVGADTLTYVNRFYIISETSWTNLYYLSDIVDFEIGYIILNKFISSIHANERFFLFFTSAVVIFSISKYIYKNSNIAWLSFFLFIALGFWGNSLNTLRQFIAIALMFPSIKYIRSKDFLKFAFFVIIASFFHVSALSFLIVYPISKIKITRTYIIIVIIIALFSRVAAPDIIQVLMDLFGYQNLEARLGDGSGAGMIVMLICFALAALFYRSSANHSRVNYDLYIHILFIAIILNVLALEFGMIGRAMIYFTIHNIILLPNIISSIKVKNDLFIGINILIAGILYFYIFRLLPTDVSLLVPYKFMNF